jgi:phosphate transport system substrate-binding protein
MSDLKPPPAAPRPISRRAILADGALLATGASQPARAGAPIRIGGTGSALAAIGLLAERYREENPEAVVQVLPSLGTTGGIRALQAGAIDLALTARLLNDAERAAGLRGRIYARTPLVFVSNPATGVTGVSSGDVVQIYAGELTDWPNGVPIRLIRRPATEADWDLLRGLSPSMAQAVGLAMERPGLVTAATDQDNAEAIEKLRGSFGLSALGQILAERRRVSVLALDGVEPSLERLAAGDWRLVRSLHLVTGEKSPPEAAAFLAFVLSTKAGEVLARYGHVPVSEAG